MINIKGFSSSRIKFITAGILLALTLSACGVQQYEETEYPEPVETPDIYAAESLSIAASEDDFEEIEKYYALKELDLTGSTCYESIISYIEEHPGVAVSYSVSIPGTDICVENSASELTLESESAVSSFIDIAAYLPQLSKITITDRSLTAEEISRLTQILPDCELCYDIELMGEIYDKNTTGLSLPGLSSSDVPQVCAAISKFTGLEYVELMNDNGECYLTFDDIAQLQTAAPGTVFNYVFTLFDATVSTADERLEYEKIGIGNDGVEEIRQILPVMTNLKYLKLDNCRVDNEVMEQLRDDFPNIKVVWRVFFGPYSVLTDTERILASIKGVCLRYADCEVLKYCTDVKYLDIGHNTIENISFVEYMPDLEVAVVSINYWRDATPLASCKKLEYLEIFNTNVIDLSPLAELTNLKHLNIGYNYISDITPLYGLTNLERLWIGCWNHTIPQSQIDEIHELLPNCEINTEVLNPTEGGWREGERYELLKKQLGYDTGPDGSPEYSY